MQKLDFTGELTTAHINEMEKFNKFEKAKVEEHYDKLSINYEDIYLRVGYPDPKKCQEMISQIQAESY